MYSSTRSASVSEATVKPPTSLVTRLAAAALTMATVEEMAAEVQALKKALGDKNDLIELAQSAPNVTHQCSRANALLNRTRM